MNAGRYIRGGNGSHWDGCEETHWDCKITALEREVEQLRAELEAARLVIHAYQRQGEEEAEARLVARYGPEAE